MMQKYAPPTTAALPPSRWRRSPLTRTRRATNTSRRQSGTVASSLATSPEFAGTLTKGAHVQVEGELRSREYSSKKSDSKQRIWEIRVNSILKLDRAEKASPEDQERDHSSVEEPAF